MASSEAEIQAQVAALQQRLQEAEATIEALIAGEVDAIIASASGPLLLQKAQEALRASEQTFRAVFQSANDAMLIADDEGRYLNANPAACELFGVAKEELLGQTAADFAPPDFDFGAAWQAFQESDSDKGEFPVLRPDGTVRIAEYNAVPRFLPGQHLSIMRDVTARKEQEEQLRFQAQLLSNVREAVVATDMERRVVYWSSGAHELFGFGEEEALGRDYRRLVSWDGEIPQGALGRQLLAEGEWRGRLHLTHKDGAPLDVDASLGLVHDETGTPAGFLGIFHDISDQVVYERELAAIAAIGQALRHPQGERETFRIIGEKLEEIFAPDGLALSLLDEEGESSVTVLGAGRWENAVGLRVSSRESLTGHILQEGELVVTEDLAAEEYFTRPDLLPEQTAALGVPLISEGTAFGVLWLTQGEPFAGWQQRALEATSGLIASAVHRARLYEQLRSQAGQLQQIMEAVGWGLLLLDEEARIVLANQAAADYLPLLADEPLPPALDGYRVRRLGGRSLSRLRAGAAGTSVATGGHIIAVPEEGREFSVLIHPIDEAAGWVLVLRDVTEERQLQEQLAQQDRLASVGQLAAGIAHDFNNIISSIILYAQVLQRAPEIEARNKERLAVIFSQARHASNLISQILDFSRRSVMERSAVDLVPLFKEWHKLWQRTLPENIHIDFQAISDNFVVNADPTRLQQAVMNIVINARDAMRDGGRLRVVLDLVRLQTGERPPLPDMEPGDWVAITIADNGEGIPQNTLSHIFDPFFTTKAPGEGTGLGLAQAHGIIQQHDGHITVRSEVGAGSTFTIYLPLILQRGTVYKMPDIEETAAPAAGQTTILVVEDQAETRVAIEEALGVVGYQVLTASGGLEALEILIRKNGEIDLVLTDMVMRDIGGLELLERVQRQYEQIAVLLMTGYPLDEASRSRFEEGALAWIQKPFAVGDLIDKIEEVLGENGARTAGP